MGLLGRDMKCRRAAWQVGTADRADMTQIAQWQSIIGKDSDSAIFYDFMLVQRCRDEEDRAEKPHSLRKQIRLDPLQESPKNLRRDVCSLLKRSMGR